MKTRFFLQDTFCRGVEVRVVQVNSDQKPVAEAMPLTFQKIEEGAVWRDPVTVMDKHTAQSLMDELWHIGYRPERGNITTGQIAATEKHLNDMRAMVGKLAGVELPN